MNSKFKRYVLLFALPLTTWACQCAQPVAMEETSDEQEAPLPQEQTTTTEDRPVTGEDTRDPFGVYRTVKCIDADGDMYGVGPECLDVDCDDNDPLLGSDGSRDCFTGPAGSANLGICKPGTQSCAGGVLGECVGEVLPRPETCDSIDNDCDGRVDSSSTGRVTRSCYAGPSGSSGVGICSMGVQVCENGQFAACQGSTTPQTEVCDGADNDCDGQLDENVTRFTRDRNSQSTDVVLRPVDVIFVVDNSGSMIDEIKSIQRNINNNFADLIAQSGIDYRVIMLSQHGDADSAHSICITSPLSGNGDCSAPALCPANTDRFFHYSVGIDTHDSLYKIASTYNAPDSCGLAPNGWSAWLRPDAAKVFIEITDSAPSPGAENLPNSYTANYFESQLFGLVPAMFGTSSERKYIFHTIAGLGENDPVTSVWQPVDPIVTDRCTGNGGKVTSAGEQYQQLSVRTGGLRYPICQYQSFDSVFREVATGIIEKTVLACDFKIAHVPTGSSMAAVGLELTTGNGNTSALTRVSGASACTGTGFFVAGTTITLCPGACTVWQNDTASSLDVTFGCAP